MAKPKGGVGSNQYTTRPATAPRADRTSEEVAWVFHPDQGLWAAAGFGSWAQMRPWYDAGFTPELAAKWADLPVSEAARWVHAGVIDPEVRGWFTKSGVEPDEAAAWLNGWSHLDKNDFDLLMTWRQQRFTPPAAQLWSNCFGLANVNEAAAWRDAGYEAREAETVRDAAIQDPDVRDYAPGYSLVEALVAWARHHQPPVRRG